MRVRPSGGRSRSVICQIVEPAAAAEGIERASDQPHPPPARACPGSIYTGIHCQQLQLGREWNGRPSLHLLTWLVTNVEGESLTYEYRFGLRTSVLCKQ